MPYGHLTIEEREQVSRMHYAGASRRAMARELGRSPSTISRELRRNGSGSDYSAVTAQRRAARRRRGRPLVRKLDDPRLNEAVRHGLGRRWSPEQIAGRLPIDHPRDAGMRVAHQTIYRWLRADPVRERLFAPQLRHRGRYRRRGRLERRGGIAGRRSIDERPREADARSRHGDWEGDTVAGRGGSGAIVTCVERRSGYLVTAKMADLRAATLNRAAGRAFRAVPAALRRTLTVDNGKEFSAHPRLSRGLGMPTYFAHPYNSNDRATSENTNGLLRQYFPKGTDFRDVTHPALACATQQINDRPRKRHNYLTPLEVLTQAGYVALEM